MEPNIQVGGSNQYINVSRGLVQNASRLQKVGYSAVIGNSFQTVWNEASVMTVPASASVLTVSSGSGSDTVGSTGAHTVNVSGLDANYVAISETVTLSGQTGVSTVNSYLRVNSLSVSTAGSGGSNAGVIYIGTGSIVSGKPSTIYNSIAVGFNASASAFTTIPAGNTGYLATILASTDTAGTQIQILTRTQGGLFVVNRIFQLGVGAGTIQQYELPRSLSAGSDIVAQAINAGSNVKVSCQFELLLLQPA